MMIQEVTHLDQMKQLLCWIQHNILWLAADKAHQKQTKTNNINYNGMKKLKRFKKNQHFKKIMKQKIYRNLYWYMNKKKKRKANNL